MDTAKEKRAIAYLKSFEPQDQPYYLCYSGGKDSDCIRVLAQLAGVNHEIHHNLTTVDAPETVRHVKSIPGVIIDRPEHTMWQLIVKKGMPPTRLTRYCCAELKERGGKGRLKITGVRYGESVSRAKNSGVIKIIGKGKTIAKAAEDMELDAVSTPKGGLIMNDDDAPTRRFVEQCYRTTSTMINPIVDWTDADVWAFLNHYNCKSNPLYQCGFRRVGCIGCPMPGANSMKKEFALYPKYKRLYLLAFGKMLEKRAERGRPTSWNTPDEVMAWWLGDDAAQLSIEDVEMEELE